jgi:tripartite-type tricarboxylate transporter receptor subunit TctC
VGLATLSAAAAVFSAVSPGYPARPVRLVLGFAPGGTSDALARVLTPKLQDALGRPWVVDNRGGASGNVATEIVARASPDGHTVLLALSSQITTSPLLYKLSFDVQKDLRPVILIASSQYMLVTHPSVKATNIKEFIEVAKSQRGALNYASVGIGSPHHLAAELFKLRAGIDMTHVPYKGGGPASAAVLANEVQVLFGSLASLHPHVKAGRIRALGMTGTSRSTEAPEVPTIAESGFPGFDVTSWFGFLVPAHTPDAIVTTLYATTARIFAMPEVREAATRVGLEGVVEDPKQFAAHIRNETRVWADVIRKANIRIEG